MSLSGTAVNKKTVTGFSTVVLLVAGFASFFQLGLLEDPEFTVKTASVSTSYPGASAEEVELEVTDRIEIALQELPQVKYLESISRPGSSTISVEILPKYTTEQLPQVWQELRSKVADVAGYATPEEFVSHVLEKEMLHFEDAGSDDDIRDKLKGLGYIS